MSADLIRPTAMALAFVDACTADTPLRHSKRLLRVLKNPNAGRVKERSVNANVSFRTAQQLKKQGAL
jgi:hypothetical protein